MIPAAFDYVRAETVHEAVAALAEHGDEAKVLAGGHSLVPLMRLRLAMPTVLVDLNRCEGLRGIRDTGDSLTVGAMTTHHAVLTDPLVAEHAPILASMTAVVGDVQVRHRGTFGGAVAHGDAAGDLGSAVLALEATIVAQGPGGRREIPAEQFFVDYLTTALEPDEVLVEVRVPKLGAGWGSRYEKFQRVSHSWATVGVCALVHRTDGTIDEARVGLTHMGTTPLRAPAVEQALAGATASAESIASAASHAADGTSPPTDLNADPEYRAHMARVLTRRALEAAAGL